MERTKKIAPKVCLKVMDTQESYVVTNVFSSRSKRMQKKTAYSIYQNLSNPSNQRISNQRILIKDCDGVKNVGKSWETKNYGAKYMIGVLDVDTKEMKLVPASIIHPKPYIKSFEETTISAEERSFGEKHKEVMLKFGDTRIRRSITGKERIKKMESSTLEEAMSEAVNATQDDHLILENPEHRQNDILPPINTAATDLKDVFLLTDFISEIELTALVPFTNVLMNCTALHVQSWRASKMYPEFVLDRLPVILSDADLAHLHLSQLLYLSYLITLLKIPHKQLKNKTANFPNTPSQVVNSIYRKFTSQGTVDGKIRTSMSDKERNKLLTHIAVLTLLVDSFSVNYTALCKDTGVSQRTLADTYRSLGCKIVKLKQDTLVNHAVLKLPIKIPDVIIRKGGKKRKI